MITAGSEGENRKQAAVPHTMPDPAGTSLSKAVSLARRHSQDDALNELNVEVSQALPSYGMNIFL